MKNSKIRQKTLINLLVFTAIMLTLLWLLQIIFFNVFYGTMKKVSLQKITDQIVEDFGKLDFKENLEEIAFKNELTVLIFTVEPLDNVNKVDILHTEGKMDSLVLSDKLIKTFLEKLGDKKTVNYDTKPESGKDLKSVTYGAVRQIGLQKVYFYVNSSIMPIDSSAKVMQNQFLIITGICILLAVLLSCLISKRICNPIEKLTFSAKELAAGNLDVNFEVNSFDEVNELASTLNYATGELRKTDKLRKDLIANVSHELRTPLTIIKAYSEMIRDLSGDNKEKRDKHISIILEESDRLAYLVNDILDLSKLESGSSVYDNKVFNLTECVNRVYNMFAGLYKEKGFVFENDTEKDILIEGDEKRIEQVVFNLIANAINYSVNNLYVKVRLFIHGDKFRFECADKGKGISEEDLPTVFDRFFRSEETNRNFVGSGIGLSLVREILIAHQFRYGVNSELNVGSTFYFEGEIK